MFKKRNVLAKSVRVALWAMGFAGINLIPGFAVAGTLTGGATLPEQVVQEVTQLQTYAKDVTTALSSVQTEINTLNGYMTDLQNLATLPSREISKITTPIQQMEYNYDEVMGLKNEYEDLYGNLANIQQTVEQQNLDILNSSLTPEDYLNTVETAQTNTAAQTRATLQEAANSMRAVDKLAPEIEAQSHMASRIDGNTSGQMEMAKELNTIEQQNQILLQDINSAQMAASKRRALSENEEQVANVNSKISYKSNLDAINSANNGLAAIPNEVQQGEAAMRTYNDCLENGGNFITCDKTGDNHS
jgi:DNA repair exonuclease SbcCD ATPase subunit